LNQVAVGVFEAFMGHQPELEKQRGEIRTAKFAAPVQLDGEVIALAC